MVSMSAQDPAEATADPAELWRDAMRRVCALVTEASAEQMGATVPACPGWSARDLLSHMVGLGADVLDGDEPDDHNSAWTHAQVAARTERSTGELVEEWQGLADDLVAWMHDHGSRPLADVVIHEQDLRGALRRPGAHDTPELAVVRDRMAGRFADAVRNLPPIALVGPGWTWCSDGPAASAATQVSAPDHDLARALMSRRSAGQLRTWTSRGDVTAYLDAFAGLGPLPDQPLPEE